MLVRKSLQKSIDVCFRSVTKGTPSECPEGGVEKAVLVPYIMFIRSN